MQASNSVHDDDDDDQDYSYEQCYHAPRVNITENMTALHPDSQKPLPPRYGMYRVEILCSNNHTI